MKTLILLRHAKSSWDYPELSDAERPLNKRGRRDAPKMGKWFKKNCNTPELIITSHSVRTLATISKFGAELGLKGKDYHTEPKLYHATPSGIWDITKSISDEVNSALLVGHNPGFTEFVNQLCPSQAIDNIPTCGIFGVKLHCSTWQEAQEAKAEFMFFQYPKNLPS